MTSISEFEGCILSVQEYKENDNLVRMCTKDQIISFIAKGTLKQNSKNRMLIQPYSYVKLSLTDSKLKVLTTGSVIQSNHRIHGDLVAQSVCGVLSDCISRSEMNESIFNALLHVYESFHLGLANVYTWACICLKEICKENGISMHVRDCVLCHSKKHIETISIKDGGFLCSSCNFGRIRSYSKDELIQYYSLFNFKENQLDEFVDYYIFTIDHFIFLIKWFCTHEGIHLPSLTFLQSIINL